jgi:hypothetical protein
MVLTLGWCNWSGIVNGIFWYNVRLTVLYYYEVLMTTVIFYTFSCLVFLPFKYLCDDYMLLIRQISSQLN